MRIEVIGIEKFPEIKSGDKLSNIIIETCKKNSIQLRKNDIIVIINFKFVHQNIKELNNLEQALEKINIITEYSILEHDKENTTFKIAYLGNPKRLSQELLDLDYELVDMQGSWAIKKK